MNPSTAKHTGLRDRSYSTPEHDALQLWLFDKTNQERIASEFHLPEVERLEAKGNNHRYSQGFDDDHLCLISSYTFTQWQGAGGIADIIGKQTEFPIYGYNRFLLGVADCVLSTKFTAHYKRYIQKAVITFDDYQPYFNTNTSDQQRNVDTLTNYITKTPDKWGFRMTGDPYNQDLFYEYKYDILCEIKPRLDSISSLISQVKIYQDYLQRKLDTDYPSYKQEVKPNLVTMVITTDENERFDEFLLEEGIRVFRVDPDELDE